MCKNLWKIFFLIRTVIWLIYYCVFTVVSSRPSGHILSQCRLVFLSILCPQDFQGNTEVAEERSDRTSNDSRWRSLGIPPQSVFWWLLRIEVSNFDLWSCRTFREFYSSESYHLRSHFLIWLSLTKIPSRFRPSCMDPLLGTPTKIRVPLYIVWRALWTVS